MIICFFYRSVDKKHFSICRQLVGFKLGLILGKSFGVGAGLLFVVMFALMVGFCFLNKGKPYSIDLNNINKEETKCPSETD